MLLLGLPFHASEIYRLSGGWQVASADTSFAATLFGCAVHVFRMPAFFVLSGFFAALILARRGDVVWLRERCLRLGVPLVFTLCAFGWLEAAIGRLQGGTGFAQAVTLAWRAGPASWSNHRWFLVVLLLYCGTTFVVRRLPPGVAVGRAWHAASEAVAGGLGTRGTLATVAALASLPFLVALVGTLTGASGGGLGLDGSAPYENFYFRHAAFFALGYALHGLDGGLDRFVRFSRADKVLAAIFIAAYVVSYAGFETPPVAGGVPTSAARALLIVRGAADLVAGFYATKLFLLGMRRHANRASATLDYLIDASLCVYLVHLVFTRAVGSALLHVDWPPTVEVAIIAALALALSLGVYEIVRRSAFLAMVLCGRLPAARVRR